MEITLSVTPEKYMSATAKVRLMGMEQAMMKVGRTSRRNSSRISTASAAPMSRFCSTELTTRWM